jgi:thiamine-monophosphate kinase
MNISKLGEFGLIQRIRQSMRTDPSVRQGIGDDCAVLEFDRTRYLLATCDMLIEDVDFTRRDKPLLVGRKSLAVSLSDIAACGGVPKWALVSIGLPRRTDLATAGRIFSGIRRLAQEYKVNIVGGDMSASEKIVIDVCCLGTVEKNNLVLRGKARPGDVIFVSGAFGGSLKGRHLSFVPRVREARYLVTHHKLHAMIDVSDGLVQDLKHILDASGTGAVLFEGAIPLAKEAEGLKDALYSGEDFELIFTAAARDAQAILSRRKDFVPIGAVLERGEGLKLLTRQGRSVALPVRGFSHF